MSSVSRLLDAFHFLLLTMLTPEDRLTACWRIQSCSRCINSEHRCGWCPASGICIPAASLLEPVVNKNICPFSGERFELRTGALGCHCSTTTLITFVVTVFVTIAALFVLYSLGLGIESLNQTFGTGAWRGTEVEFRDRRIQHQREWRRGTWFGRLRSSLVGGELNPKVSEQRRLTERSRLLG